jgi:hypothetical protein
MATPKTFTIRELFAAVACFAIASAIIGVCMTRPPSPDIGDIRYLCLGLFSPVIGGFIGLGIGCLSGHKISATALGILLPLIGVLALLVKY